MADGLEDQGDAGRGVLEIGGQGGRIAGAGRAGGTVVLVIGGGAAAGRASSAFTTQMSRSEANSESARASSRISARVSSAEIVLADGVGGQRRQQSALDAAAFVGFRAEQQGRRRERVPFFTRAWN